MQDADRSERAIEVRQDYIIEQVSPAAWYVQHPTEDDRAYLVDMAQMTCECPDWGTRHKEVGMCKHQIALLPEYEKLTGKRHSFLKNGKPDYSPRLPIVRDAGYDGQDPFERI
jgi:hypothetical protein